MLAEQLTRALQRAGIPIDGVSIGDPADRATWRVDYRPEATTPQLTTGENIRLTFDPATDTLFADEQADIAVNDIKLRALARATFELKTNAWTLQQFVDRIKAIFKTL